MPSAAKSASISKDLLELVKSVDINQLDVDQLRRFYKLDLDVCRSRANRNCGNNPRCLKGLGQPTWLINEKKATKEDEYSEDYGLKELPFSGLRNLGATCYLNTFLQLWYHNITLRKAFYRWRPNICLEENPITSLQLVLALMQFSNRSSVDPSPFVKGLKLDESQEQDPHEFSNLFINYIQNKLCYERDKSIQETIDQQYSMKIAYVIKCSKCQFVSQQESDFYELLLRVKGFKTIEECIEDYLKEESMEGNNKYACQVCGTLQNAKRFIEIRKLPPVLNLQLLRFESQNGRSRKISSFLTFPKRLEMSKFVKNSNDQTTTSDNLQPATYRLFAVLVHEGPNSHSGHYITFINREGTWYKFNDELVERLKDFNLKIDSDDEQQTETGEGGKKNCTALGSGGSLSDKTLNGLHKSKNAYMLVYRLHNEPDEESDDSLNLSDYICKRIEDENRAFLAERAEHLRKQTEQKNLEAKHRAVVKEIWSLAEVPLAEVDSRQTEAIAKQWWQKFFEAKSIDQISSVDNSRLLCPHAKLDMSASFKCVSSDCVDRIFQNFGGLGPRLRLPESLCTQCVAYRVSMARVKMDTDQDSKIITSLQKFKCTQDEPSYWVGKESFRKWKQMRLNLVNKEFNYVPLPTPDASPANTTKDEDDTTYKKEEAEEEEVGQNCIQSDDYETSCTKEDTSVTTKDGMDIKSSNGDGNPNSPSSNEGKEKNKEDDKDKCKDVDDVDVVDPEELFNHDLLCKHSRLCTDVSRKRLIRQAIWQIFHKHFPDAPEFTEDSQVCEECLVIDKCTQLERDNNSTEAAMQKSLLEALFASERNLYWSDLITGEMYYILSNEWHHQWRKHLLYPNTSTRPKAIVQQNILCTEHGNFMFPPKDNSFVGFHQQSDQPYHLRSRDSSCPRYIFVTEQEWNNLTRFYDVDITLGVLKTDNNFELYLPFCESCFSAYQEQERRKQFVYKNASIYIRKVVVDEEVLFDSVKRTKYESDDQNFEVQLSNNFNCNNVNNNDHNLAIALQEAELEGFSGGGSVGSGGGGPRRSGRKRKCKNELEIKVNSDQYLKDIKRKIMNHFAIPTYDQTLLLGDRVLTSAHNNHKLAELEILPHTVLELRVDTHTDANGMLGDVDLELSTSAQVGFKGTQLQLL